jgi:hypothetical protein
MRMLARRTDPNGWAYRPRPQICAIWLFKGRSQRSADQSKQFADKSARMVRENLDSLAFKGRPDRALEGRF